MLAQSSRPKYEKRGGSSDGNGLGAGAGVFGAPDDGRALVGQVGRGERHCVIEQYPTEVQMLSYMSQMSRSRQRECLAQRGKRRAGGQKGSVRNYVAEMGNNLWPRKYPAFAKLEAIKQKQFWSDVFTAYAAMYASASQAAVTEEDEEHAEQLVAQVCRHVLLVFAG